MAPNYMTMRDLKFAKDTEVKAAKFGPSFAAPPSTPLTWSCDKALPPFLEFLKDTGRITVHETVKAAAMPTTEYSLTAKNDLGEETVKFHITVA